MTDAAIFRFLDFLAEDREQLAVMCRQPKATVLAMANALGYHFTEARFDEVLWQTEIALAARIGEPFDFSCSMWETMWGKSYLEYLALTVGPAARAAGLVPAP